jgi:hypothetical protein
MLKAGDQQCALCLQLPLHSQLLDTAGAACCNVLLAVFTAWLLCAVLVCAHRLLLLLLLLALSGGVLLHQPVQGQQPRSA